jgi:hypothetical protein
MACNGLYVFVSDIVQLYPKNKSRKLKNHQAQIFIWKIAATINVLNIIIKIIGKTWKELASVKYLIE